METRPSNLTGSAAINPPNYTPAWWTDRHTSSWERVKDAFRRDWEQTKADLSGQPSSLNQNAGDTVKQAMGTEPVPPLGVKTHPTDPKDALKESVKVDSKNAEQAAKQNLDATKAAAKAKVDVAEKHVDAVKDANKAREQMAKESAKATEAIDKAHENIASEYAKMDDAVVQRNAAIAHWHQTEQEARYGYGLRAQYPNVNTWDDKLEGTLRTDWDALQNGRSWDEARAGVRRGWDYASRNH